MRIIEQHWYWHTMPDGHQMLMDIERAGRTCYKSEDRITSDSANNFVKKMIKSGHHAMIEFAVPPTVKVITDRGVSHEIVRHRLFSFAQESTRYCNYSKDKFNNEITVILPVWFSMKHKTEQFKIWEKAMLEAEESYLNLLKEGQSPQQARSVLPNSLKTEINIRGNVREWRHFFKLRCSSAAHPQIRQLAINILEEFKKNIPVIFDDIIGGKL